jgi:starvation-inducible outer membrane lipoprotein
MSAMKEYLIFAAVCLLAGCTTMPPLTDGVTVSLRSYDNATGDYVLELDL